MKGFGIGTETVHPRGTEIIMNRLAGKSADVEPRVVKLDSGLWPGGPQQGRAGDEIVQSNRRCIGLQPDHASNQAVVQLDFLSIIVGADRGRKRRRVDEPIAAERERWTTDSSAGVYERQPGKGAHEAHRHPADLF